MLPNGHYHIIDRAVHALEDPLFARFKKALILGTFFEDKGYVRALDWVLPTFSLSHFYKPGLPGGYVPFLTPGAPSRAEKFHRRAVRDAREGRQAAAFVNLGRACHLLVDMACPTHASRQAHATDPYEWWVEANWRDLAELPLPEPPAAESARRLVVSLAKETQRFRPDRTHTAHGAILRRLRLLTPVGAKEAAEQARTLVPLSVAHTIALFKLFRREAAA